MRVSRAIGSAALAMLACLATQARSAPGDVIRSRTFQDHIFSDLDLASDGTLWILDETDGMVYPLAKDLNDAGAPVPHPIGPSQIPTFTPRSRGLAFDPGGDGGAGSLWVLNASTRQMHEMSFAGAALRGPIALQTPQGDQAGLIGLAIDTGFGTIWTLDGPADLAIEVDPASGATLSSFEIPGDAPPETTIFGDGIAFRREAGNASVWLPTGTIFDGRPARIRELRGGAATGVEVSLAAVEGYARGVAIGLDGALRVAYVLAAADGNTTVYELDATRPTVLPPRDLTCTATEAGSVILLWRNFGTGAGGAYGSIRVFRNETHIATIAGDRQNYEDRPGTTGPVRYELEGTDGVNLSARAACTTRVGRGALLRWAPFAGSRIHDIAVDADRGELWVTDSIGNRVHRYTLALSAVDDRAGPFSAGATAVAYLPTGDGGNGSVIVGNSSNALLQELTRGWSPIGGAFPAQLATANGKVSGLTTVSAGSDPEFALVDGKNGEIDRIDDDGNRLGACSPPSTSGVVPRVGIAYNAPTDTFYLATSGGGIVEVDRDCMPTGLVLEPGIPGDPTDPERIRGIAILGNKLYACGGTSNAIFEILISPVGVAFVRGDVTHDSTVNLGDAVALVHYLFQAGASPWCLDAADSNDDGRIDISDPTFLLFFLFLQGDMPRAPYPSPGVDPTFLDPFTCEAK
ncbi:MAG: hypothetical protein JXP34_23870 [Planctomycetes bacterium]|nr:hypothetical protein [Planctomycetota bacterium]